MNFIENELFPYFQPIVSADTNQIYGYEVLGRYLDKNNEVQSLGSFFCDPEVSSETAVKVDRIIREKGIREFSTFGKENEYIFINMRLSWLETYAKKPQEMPTIKWADQYGVDYKNIVMEITEEDVSGCLDFYMTALSYYKSLGFKIAIDDYGCQNSNIYRLAVLSPDLIKIDMSLVHKSEDLYQYRQYLKVLSDFAENIGIEVVYEGIENAGQLLNCIKSKGRFYQGFFLSKPLPTIENAQFAQDKFKHCAFTSIMSNQGSIDRSISLKETMDKLVDNCMEKKPYENSALSLDDYLADICTEVPSYIIRIYICNKYGFQVSSNIELGDGTIFLADFKNRNWAWRGYFTNAMRAISNSQTSYLTQAYRDVSTKEQIYTYVRKLSAENYLFVDISKNELIN